MATWRGRRSALARTSLGKVTSAESAMLIVSVEPPRYVAGRGLPTRAGCASGRSVAKQQGAVKQFGRNDRDLQHNRGRTSRSGVRPSHPVAGWKAQSGSSPRTSPEAAQARARERPHSAGYSHTPQRPRKQSGARSAWNVTSLWYRLIGPVRRTLPTTSG